AMQTVRMDQIVCDWTVRSVITDELRTRLNAIHDKVGPFVTDRSRRAWVESFNVCANPDRETTYWEAIVNAWQSLGGGSWLSPKKSSRVLRVLLGVSLHIVDLSALHNVTDNFVERCRNAYMTALNG
ncbi:MAG TPA: hypothetical protein VHS31_12090, partial [Tepidisphaeraceae bacterium]|nr:hypothetical protein [Tepidisphaeraceae bacterium]